MATTLRQIPLSCSGHTRPVVHLDFSGITPDGYFLISACKDGKPMLRQGETGDWVGTFDGHKGAVWGATLNFEASKAATGAADFTAKVWDPITGDELHSFAHKHIVKSVQFSKNSDRLLTGSNEKKLKMFDLVNVDAEPVEISAHTSNIRCAMWCSNDKHLISASDDKTICIWDVASKTEIKKITMDTGTINVDISKDGDIMIVSHGNKVSFYDTERYDIIKTFEAPCTMNSASLHPDKTCFIAGGEDLKIYKFDYSTGTELESYKGHFGPIHCVRFSPDGELYASGSEDGTLRLWQTTLGKTYGLWKCVEPDEAGLDNCSMSEVTAPQVIKVEL
ncbi:serine-threonine kinase receptor-associated protein-like [Asterias rubens]|uniref:serine-threonine kinase receptor-associated protein-like n=1 Tax=Asterias rubens TaxID=7604 RepID=UPI0014550F90|nr:serine-threonine kinase receptor-associated protein-like [Asterias rubens]